MRLPKKEREAIASSYAARAHAPLWMGNDGWSAPARALQARLSAARDDGFEPADYLVAPASPGLPSDLAEADILPQRRAGALRPGRTRGTHRPGPATSAPRAEAGFTGGRFRPSSRIRSA
jgi:hypothetical protein